MNQLILGDNFEVLKKIESETVDLIYLLQQSWPYALANLVELALFMILTTWLLEKKLSL